MSLHIIFLEAPKPKTNGILQILVKFICECIKLDINKGWVCITGWVYKRAMTVYKCLRIRNNNPNKQYFIFLTIKIHGAWNLVYLMIDWKSIYSWATPRIIWRFLSVSFQAILFQKKLLTDYYQLLPLFRWSKNKAALHWTKTFHKQPWVHALLKISQNAQENNCIEDYF